MPKTRRCGVALVLALLVTVPVSAAASSAATRVGPLLASNTQGLHGGAAVTLTGSGRPPGTSVLVLQCRQGTYRPGSVITDPVGYQGHHVERWQADCNPDSPDSKVDNSGRMQLGVTEPDGRLTVVSYIRKGTLSANRTDVDYATVPVSFNCDQSSPCELVVVDAATYAVQQSFPLTFAAEAHATCGAPGATTTTGAGPFSMSNTYQHWATGSCVKGSPAPLLADYTDAGEFAGLSSFQAGNSDYALSATGFQPAGGSPVPGHRAAVFTPVAAQAAVIAFDGNYVVQDPASGQFAGIPLTDLSLTMTEAAGLFSSAFGTSAEASPALLRRNPQLSKITSLFGQQPTLIVPDGALSTPDATVLAMTTAWSALPSTPWTRGPVRVFPARLGKGAVDSSQIPLLSTLPALRTQVLGSIFTAHAVPAHEVFLYLTDSATAAELGLHTAKLQNAAGRFVAPTPASIQAGIRGMKPAADGVLSPDATNPDPAAYPLPLVQYAVSPKAAFDRQHRDRLVQFLRYATTTGQSAADLAPGVFALPTGLRSRAQTSLAQIGTTATALSPFVPGRTTKPTRPSGAVSRDTGAPQPAGLALPAPLGAPAGAGRLPAPALQTAGHEPLLPGAGRSAAAVGARGPLRTPKPDRPVAIPPFHASAATSLAGIGPAAGVVLVAVLLFAGTYLTSGRSLPTRPLTGLPSRIQGMVRGRNWGGR